MPEQFRSLRERQVLVDSSAYLALLDADDRHHQEAVAIARQLGMHRKVLRSKGAVSSEQMGGRDRVEGARVTRSERGQPWERKRV